MRYTAGMTKNNTYKLAREVNEARLFAAQQHAQRNQTHGDRPYVCHLDELDEVRDRFGITDHATRIGVFTHDLQEDCDISNEEIQERFGKRVAALTDAVTDEPGRNRKERKAATLEKTNRMGGNVLKTIDRIANFEQCLRDHNPGLAKMYRKEQDAFFAALDNPACHALMQHINALMLNSDAPAGEGAFVPSNTYGMNVSDSKRDRAFVRQLLRGEGDELLLLAKDHVYGRVGPYVVSMTRDHRGKTSVSASFRGSEDNAKVEFARLLPSKIHKWFNPIRLIDRNVGEERDITFQQLLDHNRNDIALTADQCMSLVGSGRVDIGDRIELGDNSRRGIADGLARYLFHHPDCAALVDRTHLQYLSKHMGKSMLGQFDVALPAAPAPDTNPHSLQR